MKPIFLSLGSNYSFSFALYALSRLSASQDSKASSLLKNKLAKMFDGTAYTFYKGRDAIEFALRSLGIGQGDAVLTQAFSCWAVEEGIRRTGAQPVFVDLKIGKLNPTLTTLEPAYQKAQNAKAVIIQHTLGYPAQIASIRSWCNKKGIFLIEDLAQSVGATDSDGRLLGSRADAVVLSFGRDKIIDAVSGGACILRIKNLELRIKNVHIKERVPLGLVVSDLLYPMLTWIIRRTYSLGLGKALHFLARKMGFITSPIPSPIPTMASLPGSHASLVLRQLATLNDQLEHRRKIANYYCEHLNTDSVVSNKDIDKAANLRFPLLAKSTDQFIACIKEEQIFLADRWYRAPVDRGSFDMESGFKEGSCPNATKLARKIINLPTHQDVSLKDAKRVVQFTNLCLK